MIDRTDAVVALTAQLSHCRLVTIVGPGGIGKTTVALAVAKGLLEEHDQVSDSPIWRRCAIPSRCRARLLTRSAWRSAPRIRVRS